MNVEKWLKLGIFCLGMIHCTLVGAQNFKEDIAGVQRLFSNSENFHMRMEIQVYASHQVKSPSLTKRAVMDKNGIRFHYQVDEMEYLRNERGVLVIDHREKSITYNDLKDADMIKDQSALVTPDFDSIMKKMDSVTFLSDRNGVLHYKLFTSKSVIKELDIFINKDQHTIRQLTYFYDSRRLPSNNKVVILFSEMNDHPTFSKGYFDESKYISSHNRKYSLKKEFKMYSLSVVNK